MITLYHGSPAKVEKPLVHLGRSDLDFGQGFYLTSLKEQAESWAVVICSRKKSNPTPWLNKYKFDMDGAISQGYRLLRFDSYNREWLDFIANSRRGNYPWKEYDIIEGGVADDRVFNAIENYLNGQADVDFTLKQLAYHKPNHQICLLNQQMVDQYLHYLSSEPVLTKKD